jgi:RimJ/RimL family protein N-acetyltransferase
LSKQIDGVTEVELIYLLAAHAWGQGYATEAATALRDHALGELALPRLVALIEPAHTASARVAAKLGFIRARQTVRPGGRIMDLYLLET